MPLRLTRPSEASLERLERTLRDVSFSYPEVGVTAGPIPSSYQVQRHATALGFGPTVWERAKEALLTWQAHRGAGAYVHPTAAPLTQGTLVIVTMPVRPLWVVAPCRIAYATDDSAHFGFAYGTLPGHPESGEEAFQLVRDQNDEVRFEVVLFSRPASSIARLGAPAARAIQRRTVRRYLEGVRRYVTAV